MRRWTEVSRGYPVPTKASMLGYMLPSERHHLCCFLRLGLMAPDPRSDLAPCFCACPSFPKIKEGFDPLNTLSGLQQFQSDVGTLPAEQLDRFLTNLCPVLSILECETLYALRSMATAMLPWDCRPSGPNVKQPVGPHRTLHPTVSHHQMGVLVGRLRAGAAQLGCCSWTCWQVPFSCFPFSTECGENKSKPLAVAQLVIACYCLSDGPCSSKWFPFKITGGVRLSH